MSRQSMVVSITLVGLLALVCRAGSFAARSVSPHLNKPTVEVETVVSAQPTDAEIVKAIGDNVRNGFTAAELANFKTLKANFGVFCKSGKVTIIGRMSGKANRNKVVSIIKMTSGVKMVNRKRFTGVVGGCGMGQTDCCLDGSVCVTGGTPCPDCIL